MIDEIARYSDADLAEFKVLILKKIAKELQYLKNFKK